MAQKTGLKTKHRRKNYVKKCKHCGKEFHPFTQTAQYCSYSCSAKEKGKTNLKICPTCGETFLRNKKSQIYCSHKCSAKRKKKAPSKQYLDRLWRNIIKQKANFTCEMCGRKDKRLNSHHIVGRKNLSIRWWIPNGICLCVSCHMFDKSSAHENSIYFLEWLKNTKGEKFIKELKNKSRIVYGFVEHYEEVLDYLLIEKDRLEGLK